MKAVPMLSRILLALFAGLVLIAVVETASGRPAGCEAAYAAPAGVGSYAAPPCGS